MVGRRETRKCSLPQARVVRGKHSPKWDTLVTLGGDNQVTYARATPAAENAVALLMSMWPIIAVSAMGIALLWGGSVYGTP